LELIYEVGDPPISSNKWFLKPILLTVMVTPLDLAQLVSFLANLLVLKQTKHLTTCTINSVL